MNPLTLSEKYCNGLTTTQEFCVSHLITEFVVYLSFDLSLALTPHPVNMDGRPRQTDLQAPQSPGTHLSPTQYHL